MGHYVNIAEMSAAKTSYQIQLYESFLNRDIRLFTSALEKGANPFINYPHHNWCVLYEALQSPRCSKFIKECLCRNFEINNVTNFCYKAIIYICESKDVDNLKVFVNYCSISPARVYLNLFVINRLVQDLDNANVENRKQFIEIIFKARVSANIPNHEGLTPLHSVVKNPDLNYENKCQMIKMFLERDNIDIDTLAQGELRKILAKEYPDIKLPERITVLQSLINCIKANECSLFGECYLEHCSNISPIDHYTLLVNAIENENHKCFDLIFPIFLKKSSNIDISNAIQKSVSCENNYALEELLKIANIDEELYLNLLQRLLTKMHSCTETNNSVYQRYISMFERLLDSCEISKNAVASLIGYPFQNAKEYQKYDLIKSVLRKGANINSGHSLHIIPPSLLEEHLDECVTSTGNVNEIKFKINISFKNFQTSNHQSRKEKSRPEDLEPLAKDNKREMKKILPSIAFMANSHKHRHLLLHPVIFSILQLLWQKVSHIFYINFVFCLFFISSTTSHVLLKTGPDSSHGTALKISEISSYLGISYLILRESIQFVISPGKYLKCFTNYMEILLIIFSTLCCCYNNQDLEVACILLLAYELFALVGSLPIDSISMHMLMLQTVCISFVKSFLFYSIFILTFALCFHIKSNQNSVSDKGEEFHRFSDPLKAFFKTFVMFIGEIDASNLNLDSPYSWLLFISFILFMSIILFNLLNGLAVSDTQNIRNQAKLIGAISRFNSLMIFENIVFWHCENRYFTFINKLFEKLASRYTIDKEVSFLPNFNNEIISTGYYDKNLAKLTSPHNSSRPINMRKPTNPIDKNISDQALEILKKKSTKSYSLGVNEKLDLVIQKLFIET